MSLDVAPSELGLDVEVLAHERFSLPYRLPFHLGLYLAINAIPGCFAVIDGPDCLYRKAEWVHGRHDLCSTLLDAGGRHRIVPTFLHSAEVIKTKGEEVVKRLRRVGQFADADLVLINTMPHVQIIGTQYDKLIAEVEDELRQPIYEVPSRALDGDWLDGYAEVLTTLARRIPLRERLRPGTVAILGLLMDRNEGDGRANVSELERLVEGLGLAPISTWLSGRRFAHLCDAAEAELIVALPHGVDAARMLARRTGARVIEVGQPFGLPATLAMLRAIAKASGREREAERLIQAELSHVLPVFEWLIPTQLLGRKLAFSGDPTLFDGLLLGARELGMDVLHLSAPARRPRHGVGLDLVEHGTLPPVHFAPPRPTLDRSLNLVLRDVDVMIANSELSVAGPAGRFEFGFPNFHRHALYESPYLGVRGWAWFVQEIATLLASRVRR
jgi:nitrogenase molybdenum-iron protein alpha/beta subunit